MLTGLRPAVPFCPQNISHAPVDLLLLHCCVASNLGNPSFNFWFYAFILDVLSIVHTARYTLHCIACASADSQAHEH